MVAMSVPCICVPQRCAKKPFQEKRLWGPKMRQRSKQQANVNKRQRPPPTKLRAEHFDGDDEDEDKVGEDTYSNSAYTESEEESEDIVNDNYYVVSQDDDESEDDEEDNTEYHDQIKARVKKSSIKNENQSGDTPEGSYFAKRLPTHLMKDDPSLKWFQKPHTLTMMLAMGFVGIFGAFLRDESDSLTNIKVLVINYSQTTRFFIHTINSLFKRYNSGLVAAAGAFLVFSVLYLHDGPFRRPHPIIWRFFTGLGIIYLLSLIYLFFQVIRPN